MWLERSDGEGASALGAIGLGRMTEGTRWRMDNESEAMANAFQKGERHQGPADSGHSAPAPYTLIPATPKQNLIPFPSKPRRMASGELPVQQALGSVPDATELESLDPMRLLTRAVCECGHIWQAPCVGLCPKCRSNTIRIIEALPYMAIRL